MAVCIIIILKRVVPKGPRAFTSHIYHLFISYHFIITYNKNTIILDLGFIWRSIHLVDRIKFCIYTV